VSELSLEIVEGPGAGRQVPLGEPLVVGRAQDVQVVLDDPQVSRRHARISPRGEQAIVEDLGSSNGTFVNGSELHAPAAVGGGDEVLVGVTVLEVRSMAQISERPSPNRAHRRAWARSSIDCSTPGPRSEPRRLRSRSSRSSCWSC